MEASQPSYRAGGLCGDLTPTLIPIQNLISAHVSRRAGPLSEMSLVYWQDFGRRDEIFPHERSIPATETVAIAHALLI